MYLEDSNLPNVGLDSPQNNHQTLGERKLWSSFLIQMIEDAICQAPTFRTSQIDIDAARDFFKRDIDFNMVCEFLNLDPGYYRAGIEKAIKNGRPIRYKRVKP
jgi:hypothetical protein